MNVRFFELKKVPAPARRPGLFIKTARLALGPVSRRPGELTVKFATNPEIRRINKEFLGHDYFTDVIAFPYKAPGKRTAETPFGDIVISVDQARQQARELRHPLLNELLTLIAHGILHLRGYDDHRPKDKKRMFDRQDRIVAGALLGYNPRL